MAFTPNNNLENQASGQADWDSGLNSNFTVIDRGFHGSFVAGTSIKSGDILWANSGGALFPYNPNSLSLREPTALSYKAVNSGETDYFLLRGIVSSIGVWSGKIIPGQPVFASPSTAGFCISSYSAAAFAAGIALSPTAIYFNPGQYRDNEEITRVSTLGPFATGSAHHISVDIGNRGFVRKLEAVGSYSNWAFALYSGSAKVNSEMLFDSVSGGITSTYLLDAAGFPYKNTDVASPGMLFGKVTVTSGASSAYLVVTIQAERFR